MSLIRKPSELEIKRSLTALIYGQPGVGKTSVACSTPNAILFDFDGGVLRINGAHRIDTIQIDSWEQAIEALEEVKKLPEYKSIIIDTVGKMLAYMEEYIKRTNPKMKQYDGSLSLKGFGQRKQMFLNFIKEAALMDKNVIFVAHEIEQKRGDETIIRPEIGGSSGNDLIKELDLVGYMEMYGNKRTISFTPCEKYYAKNSCNMPGVIEIPCVINEHGEPVGENVFMGYVIEGYENRLKADQQQTKAYEALIRDMEGCIAAIANAADANNFVQWVASVQHVYNSKAVALNRFQSKVASLGLVYDKSAKSYADPAA